MAHTSWLCSLCGFLLNAVVFVVPTTSVLTLINVRFAIQVFVVCAAPFTTVGFRLTRNVGLRMVMAATLDLFTSSGRIEVGIVPLVIPVGRSHPRDPRVVVVAGKGKLGRVS